jgi:hypothetical protein
MKTGAVVMLDALGFKGIWKRHPNALQKLRAIQNVADQITEGYSKTLALIRPGTMKAKMTFLSDTIVIEVSGGDPASSRPEYQEIAMASFFASSVNMLGVREPPPLAYRGVITYGEFEVEGPFVVGPAIDEAAELMNLAEAAITWLAPSAYSVIQQVVSRSDAESAGADGVIWLPWDVPVKGGSIYSTFAVQPFPRGGWQYGGADGKIITPGLEDIVATFDNPRIDIQIKKQNTERFLRAAFAKTTPVKNP